MISFAVRREVWICGGLRRLYRVTDGQMDFGEWDSIDDARAFLALLLAGNPGWVKAYGS